MPKTAPSLAIGGVDTAEDEAPKVLEGRDITEQYDWTW